MRTRRGTAAVLAMALVSATAWSQAQPNPEPQGTDAGEPDAGVGGPAPEAAPEPPAYTTVVTGTRTERLASDAVVPTEVITRRDIERTGARDLAEVLVAQPSVQYQYYFGGTGIRLQGLDPEQVVMLVDGQRITGRVRGLLDLTRIPLENVERVEIIKGPGSALYGADAMGGVVNILTRSQTRPREGTFTASFGERQELDLRATAGAKRGDWSVRLGGGRRTALPYDRNPSDAATTVMGYGGYDVNGGVTFEPSSDLQLRFDTDYLIRDLNGVDGYPTGAVVDRRERSELFNATLQGRGRISATDGTVTASARYSIFRDQLLQDQRAGREQDQYEQAIQRLWDGNAQWEQPLTDAHVLTTGVEQAIFLERAPRFGADTLYRYRTSLYAQDEWKLLGGGKLTLVPGVRADIDSQFGWQPSPRVAVSYKPRNDLHLRLAYGWGFRPPSFQELYISFANPAVGYTVNGNTALKPERSQGVTLAMDHAVSDTVQFGLSLFRNELRDLITVVTVSPATAEHGILFGYENIGRARTQGGEASARFRVYDGTWLDLGYTLLDARDVDTGALLEGRAAHTLSAQLSGRIRPLALEFNARVSWTGPRTFYPNGGDNVIGGTNSDVAMTEPSTVVEARVSRRFFRWGSAFLGVHNLLDAGDAVYLPMPPRQFYGGIKLELP